MKIEPNFCTNPQANLEVKNLGLSSSFEVSIGFMLGLTFNFLGFYILQIFSKKVQKRKGCYYGVVMSLFVIIWFLTCFVNFHAKRQSAIQLNRRLAYQHKPQRHILNFTEFMKKKFGYPVRTLATKSEIKSARIEYKQSRTSRKLRKVEPKRRKTSIHVSKSHPRRKRKLVV